jgi:phosphate transport system substrate-binding protein
MWHTETRLNAFCWKAAHRIVVCSILVLVCSSSAVAQTAETLAQVKKVYVEPFGQENGASKLRDRMVEQLQRKAKLEIVAAPGAADAIVKGNGSIWVTGYISSDPKSPGNTRQPILRGFLSVEVAGKNNEPLWSYLVTPSKLTAGEITKDLVDHITAKLIVALEQKSTNAPVSAANEAIGETTLIGAGATFPAPLYQKWFELFQQRHPSVRIKYNAVGSEAGLQALLDGKLDFAASDMPLSDERTAQSKQTFLQFASVIGAVVPAYNLKGVDRNLNFTPKILAGIYLGKIKKWNDAAIRESNRSVALPETDIVVIHRSDGSGTTFVLSDYLSKVNPEWKASIGAGTIVHWPMGTGAEGNDGVAATVQQTANSIGYVELVYALRRQLNFGVVQNAAGQFIQANLPSVTAAAANVSGTMGSDSRVSITNAPGKDAYPIASFTWWLLPRQVGSDAKHAAFRELLQWMLTSGQKECSALGYAPLPREVANREIQLLDELK